MCFLFFFAISRPSAKCPWPRSGTFHIILISRLIRFFFPSKEDWRTSVVFNGLGRDRFSGRPDFRYLGLKSFSNRTRGRREGFEIFSSELELYNSGKLIVRQEDYSYDVMKETFVNSGENGFPALYFISIYIEFLFASFVSGLFLIKVTDILYNKGERGGGSLKDLLYVLSFEKAFFLYAPRLKNSLERINPTYMSSRVIIK